MRNQTDARCFRPLRIVGPHEGSQIPEPTGGKHRIAHSMRGNVRIRVASQTFFIGPEQPG